MGTSINVRPPIRKTATAVKPTAVHPLRLGLDPAFLVTVITLLVFGLLMVYSASFQPSLLATEGESTSYFFTRQLVWVGLGVIAAVVTMTINYRRLGPYVVWVMGITLVVLLAVILFGEYRLNSRRALLGGSIQPSELAKLVTVVYLAYWLFKKGDLINNLGYGFFPVMGILVIVASLIFMQPDMSAAITVVAIGMLLFFLADVNVRQIIFIFIVVALLVILVVTVASTASDRFAEWKTGLENPATASPHMRSSIEAIVRGGTFGVGIGNGFTKFSLPVPHTDSIFSVIIEETGAIGAFVVLALYVLFLWRGLKVASRATDVFGKLLAAGVTLWITFEAFINMAVMVGILPFAGNALPMMSYGGSSILTTMMGIGLILNVSRVSAADRETRKEGKIASAVVNLRGRDRRWSVSGADRPANTRR